MCTPVLTYHPQCRVGFCGQCQSPLELPAGLQMHLAEINQPVCASCARQLAPALVALMGLAGTACRTAEVARHTVCPPLTTLLDLARAAETYATALPPPVR